MKRRPSGPLTSGVSVLQLRRTRVDVLSFMAGLALASDERILAEAAVVELMELMDKGVAFA